MDKKRSMYNILSGTISQLFLVGLGFISRRLFIFHLGNEINGLNSYLGSVVNLLGLLEFGLGTVFLLQLYAPLQKGDTSKLTTLLQYFSSIYKKIAFFTVILAILYGFLLPYLVDLNGTEINLSELYLIFSLFVLGLVINYFFASERVLVQANQKMYLLTTFDALYSLSRYSIQIFILITIQNYVLYLVTDIVLHLIELMILRGIIRKKYSFLIKPSSGQLSVGERATIRSSTKSLGMHKFSNFLISSSDNFFLSNNLSLLGNLTNYNLIISTVSVIFSQFATNLTAGFGNMLISGEKQQHYNKYRLIGFVNFLLTNFAANCLWILISPFIGSLWLSSNYLLDNQIVFVLIFNFIVVNLSSVTNTMRSASGEYKQDRGVQLVIALIKISLSWIGINLFGLMGLLLATSVAYVIREGIIVPRIVYGTVLKVPIYLYYKEYGAYFSIIFINMGLMSGIEFVLSNIVASKSIYFFLLFLFALVVPTVLALFIFRKTQKMSSVRQLVWKALKKGKIIINNYNK